MSYSLYLWHWGVLAVARWTIGINTINSVILISLIFLISYFSFEFIEKPFRNFNIKRIHIYSIGMSSLIFGSISIKILEKFQDFFLLVIKV